MTTTILVGAGAEVDLGLPSGSNYLVDTYFTKKKLLYDALSEYYRNVSQMTPKIPSYQKEFLFNSASVTFMQLIKNMENELVASLLDDVSFEEYEEDGKPNKEQRAELFKKLIDSPESGLDSRTDNSGINFEKINYYGILESLFSCLIKPWKNPAKFWRLINFYWSAYFSIVRPLLNSDYARTHNVEPTYTYALSHLDRVSRMISSDDFWSSLNNDSYYFKAQGKFDHVLTTNYTPFCNHLAKGERGAVFLSGRIDQFESGENFEIYPPDKVEGNNREVACPFPFLMSKAPIKPLINSSQIAEYGRALEALDDSQLLVVLGYSFNQDDAHICALVRHFLERNRNNRLTFFSYSREKTIDEGYERYKVTNHLAEKLRMPAQDLLNRCDIE